MRWQPALRTLPPYHDDPAYIAALKTSVEAALAALDFAPQAMIASFHGMPQRTLELGDPYHCHCRKTARAALRGARPRADRRLPVPLRPRQMARAGDRQGAGRRCPGKGVTRVAIFAPGFAADCLETLEELAIRGRETFLAAGGTDFAYLPCLNDSAPGMEMLRATARAASLKVGARRNKASSTNKNKGEDHMARVAIVTGGTRGIGEAISVALKDMGVTVAANYAGNDEKAARLHRAHRHQGL